jgi:hypothetical protein
MGQQWDAFLVVGVGVGIVELFLIGELVRLKDNVFQVVFFRNGVGPTGSILEKQYT